MSSAARPSDAQSGDRAAEPSPGVSARDSYAGPAMAIAFVVFLIVEAAAGEPAGSIVFFSVLGGLLVAFPAFAAYVSRARRANEDVIRAVAMEAADRAVERALEELRSRDV